MAETASERQARVRERLDRSRSALLEAVAALDETDLARPIAPESEWTAKDLVGHLAYAEAGMLPLIRGALPGAARDRAAPPTPPDFDIDRWNASRVRRAAEQSVPQLLDRLAASRREALALLDGLTDADLDRPVVHPVAGETTVEGVFRIIAFHERGHTQELRAVQAGAAAGERPRG